MPRTAVSEALPSGLRAATRWRRWGLALAVWGMLLGWGEEVAAQAPKDPDDTARRLELLEQKLRQVTRDNRRLAAELEELRHEQPERASASFHPADILLVSVDDEAGLDAPPSPAPPGETPWLDVNTDPRATTTGWELVEPAGVPANPHGAQPSGVGSLPRWSQGWHVGYDRGFLIAPTSDEQSPFSLKITNQAMFRYAGFLREVETWTDYAGDVHSVNNFSNFQIPRGRLSFAGGALVPDLNYQVIIDYNTVTSTPIGFRAYLLSYEFSDALTVHVGQNKVPGTREWLTSAFQVQGPDRSLATTFFRPSLSQGIWITGRVADDFHYHAMLSNGFNTSNLPARDLNVYPCWSGSIWWEPWGEFGKDMSDLQWHEQPALRIGTSQTFAHDRGSQANSGAPENSVLRLTDGNVITDTGALAPGVTLSDYSVFLSAFDLGWKYQGLSLLGELYLQTLGNLEGNGPLPVSSTQALGGYLQGGVFVLPKEFELYGRGSLVTGDYGTGGEYAGGFNWFPLPGQDNLRVTTDLAYILRSPADQNRTNYNAGYTGWLLRAQVSTSF